MIRTLFCCLLFASTVVTAADRPNVIFFLSDDQRADFLGCAGHEILKTPNIDALASRGTRFENAFVTTAICAASRATLFTGLYERSHKYTFGTPPLADEIIDNSYFSLLKKGGYRTGFVGKFGVNVGKNKTDEMFDSYVPLNRSPYFKPQPDGTKKHLTDITGDKAIEFVKSCSSEQPFCIQVSFNAPHAEDNDKVNHYPWPPSEDGLYEEYTIPPPLVDVDHWKELPAFFHDSMHRTRYHWRWDTPEKYQRNVKAYYRMITGVDRNIGRVLTALEEQGLTDNTIVIFMGDNGYYKGSRGFAGKWSHWDESLRVPLVICDPRVEEKVQGQVNKLMALNVDVPATILSYTHVEIPNSYQGVSLTELVSGVTPTQWRVDFFCEHLMDRFDIPKYEGVRGSRYVYARYFENMPEGEFLHDLKTDPLELKNLVNDPQSAAALATMRKRCDELRDQLGGAYSLENIPTIQSLKNKSQ